MSAETCGEVALRYANLGFPVFRVQPNSKIPLDRWVNGDEHNVATTDYNEIVSRWSKRPHANVGIATGRKLPDGGYLTVLDLDTDEPDFAGRPVWAADTYTVVTPSGGLHLYYRTPDPVRSGRIAPGIDVKSRGGMVVAPPSSIDGRFYYAIHNELQRIIEMPIANFCPTDPLSSGAQLATSKQRQSFARQNGVGEGGRDNYLAAYAGWLLNRREYDEWEDLAVDVGLENDDVCSPPMSLRDCRRIARSIFQKAEREWSVPL